MLTQLQDTGRTGMGHQGLTQGGPMDLHAYCWANYLLGNRMGCSQLEIMGGQTKLLAHQAVTLALTGADLRARVNSQPVDGWQTIHLNKGDTLSFQFPKKGLRAYLAIPGGFAAPAVFGSVATVVRDGVGGLGTAGGRSCLIGIGDFLESTSHQLFRPEINCTVPARYVPDYGLEIRLNLIESYQARAFSEDSRKSLFETSFTLSSNSDRMGYRLDGAAIIPPFSGVISEGIALGAVQIPENGQPIILMRDHQTLGGYPKFGCVAQLDLNRLAQAVPGTTIRFQPISLQAAGKKLTSFYSFFNL
ncbi:biotin-dependent carboxyltransferase family protein [Endozoicomonas sp. SCSIO W0465]|uniref:5-oxoprolinase subunit C family protein n=1 Tax=Endozoicomonas sp. SCSIO W0465 TaxID=2918516 RepID=UPI002074FF26|nr:biotin-dependent carboxyltransferase family protein [Endozoicomonas sp. SCSIO W0465]USE35677.1 biotin-dependent carboxyltransferase family protein [Endozoicomonas sp. SCSIO W0465]